MRVRKAGVRPPAARSRVLSAGHATVVGCVHLPGSVPGLETRLPLWLRNDRATYGGGRRDGRNPFERIVW
jgi:hypothetical protein